METTTKQWTGLVMERVFNEEDYPQYTSLMYDILTQYIDDKCDNSDLEEYVRTKLQKMTARQNKITPQETERC